ncbi:GNAT family N-acetyltransferase [Hyphomicrobium methylovorum]|uniref:GNAT family N-acetyltransferase n=1 Tax=Hyphomicrobium methylovorum TaxID=84 RepID=UPI0015E75E93|nr:GNAT family N-acetyltransferase [Hyphomicrobium methylovorum]MBA2127114.1 GNAT family N-acetyltransferase [Hyphomicrobium methylovorum]
MAEPIIIQRYRDIARDLSNAVAGEIDEIFFEASNTKSFATPEARIAFRHRWLGRYLANYPHFAYVAIDREQRVAGYLVGAIEKSDGAADADPFATFAVDYPAHLHVNVAARDRGRGIGGQLIAVFVDELRIAGAAGVHVVTSAASDNVRFYKRNGFAEVARGGKADALVFLGRRLR